MLDEPLADWSTLAGGVVGAGTTVGLGITITGAGAGCGAGGTLPTVADLAQANEPVSNTSRIKPITNFFIEAPFIFSIIIIINDRSKKTLAQYESELGAWVTSC